MTDDTTRTDTEPPLARDDGPRHRPRGMIATPNGAVYLCREIQRCPLDLKMSTRQAALPSTYVNEA